MKKLSRTDLKKISGGFNCNCGTWYIGEYTSLQACANDCARFFQQAGPGGVN